MMRKGVYDPVHDVVGDAGGEGAGGSVGIGSEEVDGRGKRAAGVVVGALKRADGVWFSRGDLDYTFLLGLATDGRVLFDNPYKNAYRNLLVPRAVGEKASDRMVDGHYDVRTFAFNEKLTFGQLYLLTIASSKKCSRVLCDKLFHDSHVALCTCILGVLVNIGRLNTTINFYLEMTSQLRTFHSVPCLQYGNNDPKCLQDTPRLKSILKNIPMGNGAIFLAGVYGDAEKKNNRSCNVVNLIFSLLDDYTLVNEQILSKYISADDGKVGLNSILDKPKYNATDRVNAFLWLLYIHLETDLSKESIAEAVALFSDPENSNSPEMLHLRLKDKEYDIDPMEEIQFGKDQQQKRLEFLKKIRPDDNTDDTIDQDDTDIVDSASSSNKPQMEIRLPTDITVQEIPIVQDSPVEAQENTFSIEIETTTTTNTNTIQEHVPLLTSEHITQFPIPDTEPTHDTTYKHHIDDLIDLDNERTVCAIGELNKTQRELVTDLETSHIACRKKRKEIGLLRVFNEYEDVPMASVLGIRGRKKKKYRDGVLGFESDYLKYIGVGKDMLQEEPRVSHPDPFRLE